MEEDFNMNQPKIDRKIFWGAIIVISLLLTPLLFGPDKGIAILNSIRGFLTGQFGWLYMWITVAVFVVLLWLSLGKYANVKFGNAKPEFSTLSWVGMMFTAGIGSGLMYWGVIEWAYYYLYPPFGMEPKSVLATEWAATYGLFHWGFTAWAIYCLPALPIAYAFHVRGKNSLSLSSACRGVLGRFADGWAGKIIDVFFIFGIIGAVGTSLGLATPMISYGVTSLTGIPQSLGLNIVIIVCWTLLFGFSAFLGLKKGIKRLSDINVYLALGLGVFIFIGGPTLFIVTTFTNSVGILLQNFIQMSFYMDPIRDSAFAQDWTIFYWAWWVAYAPFVGLFVARISRGRTIRQVIFGMCIAGSLGCWIMFAILGNTSMYFELNNVVAVTEILSTVGAPAAIISTLQALPLGSLVVGLFLILSMIFLATMLDSASFTIASVVTNNLKPEEQPARWHRMFWALILGVVAILMMFGGGLAPLQTLTIITAFPLLFVITLMTISFLKWLKEDEAVHHKSETTNISI
jgi:BCCT family betaine/carnitine transporter